MKLTSTDREPPVGSVVVDHSGITWMRVHGTYDPDTYWVQVDDDYMELDADPESWIKVAGNYGPVEVVLEAMYD